MTCSRLLATFGKTQLLWEKQSSFIIPKKLFAHIARGEFTEMNISQRSLNKIHALPPEKKRCAVLCMP